MKSPDYGLNAPSVEYSDILPTYIRITDISDDGKFLHESKTSVNSPNSDKFFLQENDIVLARTGASVGKSYLHNSKDGGLVFAGFLIRVKVNPNKLNARYLKGILETKYYWNWVRAMSMRSGQPGINGNEYSQLSLPLAPLSEQAAIAEALSDADALISRLEQLIAKKRNIKQGAMQELLTGTKRLPGFSGEWEVKKFTDVCWFQEGPGVRNTQFTYSGVKLLNGTNIFKGKLLLENTDRFISESEAFGPYSHFLADEGDIVIACSGITIDRFDEKISFVRKEHLPLCMNTSTMRFKTHGKSLRPRYLYYYLMSRSFNLDFVQIEWV